MATFTYEQFAYRFKNPTVDGNLDLLDDGAIIKIAADDDLQLTHSGSVGDITCSTGALDINAGTVNIKDEASSETMASFVSDGAVTLNHDNTARLATTSAGIDVTGTLAVSGTSAFTGKITSDNGIDIDNINIDGTTIALSSGSLTLDVAADITLDADSGSIVLKDGGTQFGVFTQNSNNLRILSGSTTAATFSGANVTFAGTLASGAITSSGDVTAFSDMRIKHDIETIEGALAKVSDMRGVYFKRNDGEPGTGVIAQEIENILPEVVKDGEYKSVAYGNMVGILIEAIKELKAEVEKLKESK
jgi:cytoskeletal protein CcmA (bactofilin family)